MVRLRLLGPPVVAGPDGPLGGPLAGKHALALLALLAVEEGPLPRDKIAGYLWSERTDRRARHRLSDVLYLVRRALGPEAIRSVGDGLLLNRQTVRSDVAEAREALERGDLQAAVDAYGGPFLDGFFLGDAGDFERWLEARRDAFARTLASTLERLALQRAAEGDLEGAAAAWRKMAAMDPTDSRVTARLAEALAATGNTAAGIERIDLHEATLADELGIELPHELRDLRRALEAGDPRKAHVPRSAPARPPEAARPLETARPLGSPRVIENGRAPPTARARSSALRWTGALLAASATVVVGFGLFVGAEGADDGSVSIRMAVLPFRVPQSDIPTMDVLAEGLHDEVISRLTLIPGIVPVGRTSVLDHAGAPDALRFLSRELDVEMALEGTLVREGERTRLLVRVLDAPSGSVRWSRTLDADGPGLLDLQADLAARVAEDLGISLGSVDLGAEEPRDPTGRATEAYLEARAWTRRALEGGEGSGALGIALDRAVESAERALAVDPDYAAAHAQIGIARALGVWLHGRRTPEDFAGVRAAVRRAEELASTRRETRLARLYESYLVERDFSTAIRLATVLRARFGDDPDVIAVLMTSRKHMGLMPAALETTRLLLRVDPLNSRWVREEVALLERMGRVDEAHRALDRAAALWPRASWVHTQRMRLALQIGDTVAAKVALDSAMDEAGPHGLRPARVMLATLLGHPETAVAAIAELEGDEFREQEGLFPIQLLRGRYQRIAGRHALAAAQFDTAAALLEARLSEGVGLPSRTHQWLAMAYAATGRAREAVEHARIGVETLPAAGDEWYGPVAELWRSRVLATIGEREAALTILEELLSSPFPVTTPALLRLDPEWYPLREDPRFAALVRRP